MVGANERRRKIQLLFNINGKPRCLEKNKVRGLREVERQKKKKIPQDPK